MCIAVEAVPAPANLGTDPQDVAHQGGREEQVSLIRAQGPCRTVCQIHYPPKKFVCKKNVLVIYKAALKRKQGKESKDKNVAKKVKTIMIP